MSFATRTFTEYGVMRADDGAWLPRGQLGQQPIDAQIRAWVDLGAVEITGATAPGMRIANSPSGAVVVWLSVSLIYLQRQGRMVYVKTFVDPQRFRRTADGQWEPVARVADQPDLEAQIAAWVAERGVEIVAVSPPGFYHYWLDSQMVEKCVMTGVAVLYDNQPANKRGCS